MFLGVYSRLSGMSDHSPTDSAPRADLVRVGATIRTLREVRGLTQDQLAQASGLSRAYLANIEAGRKKVFLRSVARIAAALHVPQIAIIAEMPAVDDPTRLGGVA